MFCLVDKTNITDYKYNTIKDYILYENDKYYYLPRYARKYLNHSQIFAYRDNNFIYDKIVPFDFYSSLLPRQQKVLSQLQIKINTDNVNGIIHARPGFGKTVFGMYLIYLLLYKTIIFVDSNMLYEQWLDEIFKHTSLKKDDIGLIKGDKFNVDNKRIIFTTPQTMASKFKRDDTRREYYKKIKSLGINMLFWDESHIISNKWAASFLFFDTLNIIGFTATPYFSGKQLTFMNMLFDNVIAKYNKYSFTPIVEFVNWKSNITNNKDVRRLWATYKNQYIMFLQIYNKLLYEDTNWYNVVLNITKSELENEKNKIIIIVNTKKQMNKMYSIFKGSGISATKLYAKERDIDKINDRVIIAIYKIASKAFDNKYLNRAILPIPISGRKSLTQTIGRILRDADGKEDAKVYILRDTNKPIKGIFDELNKIQYNILKSEYSNIEIKSN